MTRKTTLKSTLVDGSLEVVGDILGEKITNSESKGIKFETLSDRLEDTEYSIKNIEDLAGEIIEEAEDMRENFEETKRELDESIVTINEAVDTLAINLGETEDKLSDVEYHAYTHKHDYDYSKLGHKHTVLDLTDLDLSHNHDSAYSKLGHTHTIKEVPHDHDETYSKRDHIHSNLANVNHKHSVTDLTDLNLEHNHHDTYAFKNHDHDSDYSRVTHKHDDEYSKLRHNHDDEYSYILHKHDDDYSHILHKHEEDYSRLGHTHSVTDLTDLDLTHDHDEAYSELGHTHSVTDLTDLDLSHDHDEAYSKLEHNHAIKEVEGLNEAIDSINTEIEEIKNNTTPPEHTHDEYALKQETYTIEEVDELIANAECEPEVYFGDEPEQKEGVLWISSTGGVIGGIGQGTTGGSNSEIITCTGEVLDIDYTLSGSVLNFEILGSTENIQGKLESVGELEGGKYKIIVESSNGTEGQKDVCGIILSNPLHSLEDGSVKDRIYFDNERKKVVVERNVDVCVETKGEVAPNGTEYAYYVKYANGSKSMIDGYSNTAFSYNGNMVCKEMAYWRDGIYRGTYSGQDGCTGVFRSNHIIDGYTDEYELIATETVVPLHEPTIEILETPTNLDITTFFDKTVITTTQQGKKPILKGDFKVNLNVTRTQLKEIVGDLDSLQTTTKESLVEAINELYSLVATLTQNIAQ